uniref:Uncharacterized protein n=1 Tax=Anguilla anguilla TaxID=7936 RepID=A0A0E9SZ95_ANGAN
MIAINNQQ